MKKTAILILLVLLIVHPQNAFALGSGAVSVSLPNLETEPGTVITTPITVSDLNGIAGWDLTINFNSSILTPLNITLSNKTANFIIASNTNSIGVIKISAASKKGAVDSSHLEEKIINIAFKVSFEAHIGYSSYLNFSNAYLYDENGTKIPVTIHNGGVKITSPSAPFISLPDITAIPDTTIKVPVHITDFNNLSGYDFAIRYNPRILQATGISTGKQFSEFITEKNLSAQGIIKVSAASENQLSDVIHAGGDILNITFKVLPDAPLKNVSSLSFMSAQVYNENAQIIPSSIKNGSVTIDIPSAPLVYIPNIQTAPGFTVNVPIDVTNISNIAGCDIILNYDPNILTPIKSTLTKDTANFLISSNFNNVGRVILSMASEREIAKRTTPDGKLAVIEFKVSKNSKSNTSTFIGFSSVNLYDKNTKIIQSLNNGGNIEIGKTYIINASAGPGGTITPSGTVLVNYGDKKSFTIQANPAFMIHRILVDNAPVSFNNPIKYTYTFTNVTDNHTISAEFVKIPDVTPPTITLPEIKGVNLNTPGAEIIVSSGTFTFTVSATDASGIAKMVIKVNGIVQIDKNNLDPTIALTNGVNDIDVIVYDTYGNFAQKSFKIISDTTPPLIHISSVPATVTSPSIVLKGSAIDLTTGIRSLNINGNPVSVSIQGNFETTLKLSPGANNIKIKAIDKAGNETTKIIKVTYVHRNANLSYIVILKINSPYITVNGISKKIDTQGSKPIIQNGRTLLPIRTLIESLGGSVRWNAKERKISIMLNGHSVILWIKKPITLVDGVKISLDVPPKIINNRTYVPLRFISEHLGASVQWDGSSKTITIYYWY